MKESKDADHYALELKGVTKRYGSLHALDNVSLQVKKGHVHGFLGLNGAGKTTTIKLLMDFIRPSSGIVRVFGKDAHASSTALKQRIGYLSGDFELYGNLNGDQYLRYVAHLRGVKDYDHLQALCKDLEVVLDRKIASLSRGNKQKIGLVAALVDDPDLLILDEPTTGLDPLMQQKFYEVVRTHAKRGKTVFMSSHIMSEVEEVCDMITFMKKGKVTKTIDVRSLRNASLRHIIMRPADGAKLLKPTKKFEVRNMKRNETGALEFDVGIANKALLRWIAMQPVKDVTISEQSLEDIFLELYTEKGHV